MGRCSRLRSEMLSAIGCAEEDERVVAAAAVGSLALNGGDRFSDLDLTFGIPDGVRFAGMVVHEHVGSIGGSDHSGTLAAQQTLDAESGD